MYLSPDTQHQQANDARVRGQVRGTNTLAEGGATYLSPDTLERPPNDAGVAC